MIQLRVFWLLSFFALPAVGLANADSLLVLLSRAGGIQKAIILNKIAKEIRSNYPDSALGYAEEAGKIARKLRVDSVEAEAINQISVANLYLGDLKNALTAAEKSLLIWQKIGHKVKQADLLNNIGVMYRRSGKHTIALTYFIRSSKLKEELGDPEDVITSLNNIGTIYYYQKDYKQALAYYQKALQTAESINNEVLKAAACNNLALAYFEQGLHDSALVYNSEAHEIRLKHDDIAEIAGTLCNFGRIYQMKGDETRAIKYYLQSIQKYKLVGNQSNLARTYQNLGTLYSDKNNFREALVYFQKALRITEEFQNLADKRDIHKDLAVVHYRLHDMQNAYEHLEEYTHLNDSLLNVETIKQLSQLSAEYESEKKEKQIEILKKENKIKELLNDSQQHELKKQKIFKYYFSALSGLGLVIALMFYTRFRDKKKAHAILQSHAQKIEAQKMLIEKTNEELGVKNKEITDSIRYAKRIQQAIFPPAALVQSLLPDSMIFFKPKDIVSGDFYWLAENGSKIFVAAVDCTGHGVPGAFMSIVGHNALSYAVNDLKLSKPSEVLDHLNRHVTQSLHQFDDSSVKDGMDLSLVAIDRTNGSLEFAGANNPLYILRGNGLEIIKGDKFPIGRFISEEVHIFNNYETTITPGMSIFLFTDGYADQFGGEQGKKFKYSRLQQLLLDNQHQPMQSLRKLISSTFETWKGDHEQVDDVCIIGVRL